MPTTTETLVDQITAPSAVSQWVPGLETTLGTAKNRSLAPLQFSKGKLEICLDTNSWWLIYSFQNHGKLAIRTCFDPQSLTNCVVEKKTNTTLDLRLEGALGQFHVRVELIEGESDSAPILHYTTTLRPRYPLIIEAFPRDVYVLDSQYKPLQTEGIVYATQSGPAAGIAYFSVTKPKAGTVLYFQNLTALNGYCEATHTNPSGVVAVQWPELGLSLPRTEKPLPAGQDVTLSDAYLVLNEEIPANDFGVANYFLDSIAQVYQRIQKPETSYYDWPEAARKTLISLSKSSDCHRKIKNRLYLNAYVNSVAKPPESMVHFAVLLPLLKYQSWQERKVSLAESLAKSASSFFDAQLGILTRWLPGEKFRKKELSEEEDVTLVDSWYLFHTLLNIARLAEGGSDEAKEIFLKSLPFVVKAAHHFNYDWPVFYRATTFEVIKAETEPGAGGEHDVPGLYAYAMLYAYEFTKDEIYLPEAEKSALQLKGKGFQLLYQTNNTITSAVGFVKLWKITGNRLYYDLSTVCLANVVAKMWIWSGEFGYSKSYCTFLGLSPLHDGTYVAAYEEMESLESALLYLQAVGDQVLPSVNALLAEYMKYLLHRGRYYFPSELPEEVVSTSPKEGEIHRNLTIPLEDLRMGWEQAGQVGQEVYGSASAFIMTSYAYLKPKGVPFLVYADYPVLQHDFQLDESEPNTGVLWLRLGGSAEYGCRLRILLKKSALPPLQLFEETESGKVLLKPQSQTTDYLEFQPKGGAHLRIEWKSSPRKKTSSTKSN